MHALKETKGQDLDAEQDTHATPRPHPPTATARTATGCECYMIDKSAFDRLLKKSLAVTL
eukprot:COSAG05_NODE_26331_length_189_cov_26.055556_1_plen_59_part_10